MALQVKFPFGKLVDVFVTHVDEGSGNFFIQKNDAEAGNLDVLMAEIEEYAKGAPTSLRPADITVGDLYIAQYLEDERWYRARVLDVKDQCEVFFVDYGNTEFVHPSCVRKAKEKFLDLPGQAFECELDGIENVRGPGFQDSISSLKERILEQELTCRGVSLKKNNILVVNLYTDKAGTTSVMSGILSAGLESRPASQLDMKYKAITLEPDSFNDLCVTHVQDPGHFWCQLLSNAERLQELMDDLAQEYSDPPGKTLPDLVGCSVGRPCCTKFAEDDCWYRSVITNVGSLASGLVEVRFVDYGNIQKTSLSDVKELKAYFQDLPVQAVECMVEGLQPASADRQWSVEAMRLFSKLIKDKHVVGLMTGQESDGRHQLRLFDTTSEMDLDVNQVLIAAGYAVKVERRPSSSASQSNKQSPDSHPKAPVPSISHPVFAVENIPPGVEEKVLVSSVDSPSLFYCQLFRSSSKLLKLMKDINQHYSKLSPSEELLLSPSPGDPCCAQFSEDGCWYRAIVKEVSSDKAKVLYVDYGNSESLSTKKIKRLLPRFSELPKQGIECSLNRIRSNSGKSWREKSIQKFQAMTEGEARMRVIAQGEDGISRVELVIKDRNQEKNASEELLLDGSAQLIEGALPSSEHFHEIVAKHEYPDLTLTIGQYEDVVVSFTENPCNFWCQLIKSSKELEVLMREMEEYYTSTNSKNALSSPHLGMPCCAQFTEDDVWYRGKIVGTKKGNLTEVHFVDYGNSEVLPLSRTRPIKPQFMRLGPQAIRCALSNIIPPTTHSWSEEVMERFEELTMDKELILRADYHDKRRGVYLILLVDTSEGKNLSVHDEIAPLLSQKVGVDIPSVVIKQGTQELVYVTSVTCKEKFYCQVMKTGAALDELMNRIENHYAPLDDKQEQLNRPVVGSFCAAKYALDDSWYRAKIVGVHVDSISLHYVDYGNSETLPVSRVKTLQPEFATLPCQVFESTLGRSAVGFSDDQFKEHVFDKEFKAKVVAVKGDGLVEVELLSKETGRSVTEFLKKTGTVASPRVSSFKLNAGEKKTVYITVAEGVLKFFCQVTETSESLDELMNKLEHHYSSLADKVEALASPRVGDFCVAKFTDDQSWYRAKITNVSGNHAEVLYIDYGNSETVPLMSLKVLQPEFADLPVQALGCSLSGMSGSQSDQVNRKFSELACDHEFKAHVISVKPDGVLEVELCSADGVRLQDMLGTGTGVSHAAEPSTQIHLKPETLRAGQMEEVYCVSANSPMQFWCQLGSKIEAIEQLMADVNSHYEALGAGDAVLSSPTAWAVCCAKFSGDGLWYRARVNKLYGGEVEVQFVDYGNSERIAVNEIKVLGDQFTSLPAQAVECSLADASPANKSDSWSDEAAAAFEEITFEKNLLLFALDKTAEARQEVMLSVDGVDVASELASQGHAQTQYKAAGFKPQACIKENSFLDLYPTVCDSPSQFYCQVMGVEQISALKELMDQLQEHYDALSVEEHQLAEPRVGMPCAAKFTDDNWHRATITKVMDQTSVELYYIDYGNHDVVSMERVKKIDRRFVAQLEAQAIYCSTPTVKPLSETEWAGAAVERFTGLVLEKQLVGKVLRKVTYDSIEVELFDTSNDKEDVKISEVLVREGMASSSDVQTSLQAKGEPTVNDINFSSLQKLHLPSHQAVYVTAVESPDLFFCQLAGTEDKLERLLEELTSEYNAVAAGDLSLNSVAVGDLCCTKFSEDNNWYRAVVQTIVSPKRVTVKFIDYGNKEDVDLAFIKSLKPKFMVEPALAVQCCLTGLKHETAQPWPEEMSIQFEKLTAGKELMAETASTVEPFGVKLLEDGVNIAEELLKKSGVASAKASPGRGKQAGYKDPSVGVGDTFNVFITSIVSPGKFYCQLVNMGSQLDEVMNELNNHYVHLSETDGCLVSPFQGQLCVARFSEDEMWYRARVMSLSVNNLAVQFVDYGNSETVCPSGVKQIKPMYMDLPVAAVECSLDLSQEQWTTEQSALFEELTGEKELTVKLLQKKDGRFEVRVYEEGVRCISDTVLGRRHGEQEARKHTPVKLAQMDLKPGQMEEVYVSHVNCADSFYLQLSRTSPQLDKLMQELAEVCADSKGVLPRCDLQVGVSCCALFAEDNAWYRAVVSEVPSDLEVNVEYVDYGNTASLLLSDVKMPGGSFWQLPRQAVHCGLNCPSEIFLSIGNDSFAALVLEKPLTAKFVAHGSGKWCVDLEDNGQNIVETLKGELAGRTVSEENCAPSKHYPEMTLTPGQTEAVYLSCAPEPDAFYVQMSRSSQDLEDLMAALGKVYTSDVESLEAPQQATEGTPCCAMYLEDGSWYRAEITKVLPDSQLEVIFVDYGNSEVVPASLVKELKPEFLKQPKHSVLCKLAISKTAYNEVEFFQSLDLDRALQATFTVLEEDKWLIRFEEGDGGSASTGSQPKKYSTPPPVSGSGAEMLFLYADSPTCLYLQRTDNADELEKLMCSIPTDLPKESPPDLVVGLPCLGQFTEDDSWYRAEILEVEAVRTCVRYVDYGNSEWLQLERLRPIKEKYLSLPVQAVRCSLEVDKAADSTNLTEALNTSFSEKVLHVKVLRKNDDDVYTVRLFEPGSEQPVTASLLVEKESQNGAEPIPSYYQKTKEYRRPELEKGSHASMYYIAPGSPDSIHLQFADSENELTTLMADIAGVYSEPSEEQPQLVDPHSGQPCCAQFSEDEQWYRAEIVTAGSDGMITVKFVDYGNCEVVPSSKVKELKDSFVDLQVQAVECKMSGICPCSVDQKWSEDCLVKLDELCAFKKFSVEFVEFEGLPSVILHDQDSGKTINQLLVSHGFAEIQRAEDAKVCGEHHEYQTLQMSAGDRLQVFCTSASSPHSMQLQLKDAHDKLTVIMKSVSSVYKRLGDKELKLDNPQAGQACCAKFSEDEEWYRAQVIDITDNDHINIKFVDFGNSEIAPAAHVKQLNADFLVLPIQSLTCRLAGICASSQDGAWSEECVSKLQELCESEGLVAEIVKEAADSMVVNLFDGGEDGKSVAANLVDLGYATFDLDVPDLYSYPDFRVDSEQRFFFLFANSPSSFWCQLADSEIELTALMERMSNHYTAVGEADLTLQTPEVGNTCCAKFSEDDGWYRAEVSETSKDGSVCVRFVDYGNSESVLLSNAKQLAAEFRALPVQAVECTLCGLEPYDDSVDGWSQDTIKRFEELCTDKTFLAKVIEVHGRKLEVSLQDIEDANAKSVSEILISDRLARAVSTNKSAPGAIQEKVRYVTNQDVIPKFRPMILSTETKVRVTVTHVESLSLFHCQLVDPDGKLDTLMESMASHYSFPNLENLESVVDGQACCAQFTQDDSWYRGTVLTAYDTEALVLFVDYGNCETLPMPRIKKLCEEFLVPPPQAFECAIHGLCPTEGAWSKEVTSYFEETVAYKELDVVILNASQDGTYKVTLFMEGENLNDLLLQKFPEKVCSGLERVNVTQVTEEEEEEFEDASERLTPIEDPTELAEKGTEEKDMEVEGKEMVEVGRKVSDEGSDDFQDTTETLTAPEADQELEKNEREEKELSEEAATKEVKEEEVQLEEGEQAATDADPAGEDSGEDFLEASEIVHDVMSEEDLTAITGLTSKGDGGHNGTHESSEEERDAVVRKRAGDPALPAAAQFMEEILDIVSSSVDTEMSRQAGEFPTPGESENEHDKKAMSPTEQETEELGTESSVGDHSELPAMKTEAEAGAGQQDLEDSTQQLEDAEHTLDESASEGQSTAEKSQGQEESVDFCSEGDLKARTAVICANVEPEATEANELFHDCHEGRAEEVDDSVSVEDECAAEEAVQQESSEDQLAVGEVTVLSEHLDHEMLEKPAIRGGEQREESKAEITAVEVLNGEDELGESSSKAKDEDSRPEMAEEVSTKEDDDEPKRRAEDKVSSEEVTDENSRTEMAEEDEGDEPKRRADYKLSSEEVTDVELEMTGEVLNQENDDEKFSLEAKEELTDEDSRLEMAEELSNSKDDELRQGAEDDVLSEEFTDEGSRPELTVEVLNKEDGNGEMAEEVSNKEDGNGEMAEEVPNKEDGNGEMAEEVSNEEDGNGEMAEEVPNKADEEESLKHASKDGVLNGGLRDEDSHKENMAGDVLNKDNEDDDLRVTIADELLNDKVKDEEAKPEVLKKEDEGEELQSGAEDELLNQEVRDEESEAKVVKEGDEVKELKPGTVDETLNEVRDADSKVEVAEELLSKDDEDNDDFKPSTEDEVSNEKLRNEALEAEMTREEKEDHDDEFKLKTKDEGENEELRDEDSKPELVAQVFNKMDEEQQSETVVGEDAALMLELGEEEEFKRRIEEEVLNEEPGDEETESSTEEVLNRDGKGAGCKSEMEGEAGLFKKSITSGECDSLPEENKIDKGIQQNCLHHLDDEVKKSNGLESDGVIESESST